MRLPDCVAVLTGASGGIGLELAAQLCSAGARVLAVSRQQGKLTELMARYPGQLRWQQADLRCAEGRRDVLEAARAMGSCNLLINAAGVNRFALLEQMDEAALDEPLVADRVADLDGAARQRRNQGGRDPREGRLAPPATRPEDARA